MNGPGSSHAGSNTHTPFKIGIQFPHLPDQNTRVVSKGKIQLYSFARNLDYQVNNMTTTPSRASPEAKHHQVFRALAAEIGAVEPRGRRWSALRDLPAEQGLKGLWAELARQPAGGFEVIRRVGEDTGHP